MLNQMNLNWIYLSYPWGPSCPSYGNGPKIKLSQDKSICCGDSCNTVELSASNHIGTHYDFPLHFNPEGKNVLDYSPESFFHFNISFIDLNLNPGELVTQLHIKNHMNRISKNTTLLLIRTGMAVLRDQKDYWENGCGIDLGVADFLRENFNTIQCIGIDTISITAFQSRQLGRVVHKEFLCGEKPILIIEDINLEPLLEKKPKFVIALPLRIESGDGAPATIIAGF
jgi:kynurenine formamidase